MPQMSNEIRDWLRGLLITPGSSKMAVMISTKANGADDLVGFSIRRASSLQRKTVCLKTHLVLNTSLILSRRSTEHNLTLFEDFQVSREISSKQVFGDI